MSLIDTIVVPQGAEYHAVCRGLTRTNTKLQVIPIPIGSDRATDILSRYSLQLKDAKRVLILGLCGSLVATLGIGNVVVVKSCYSLDDNRLDLDRELTASLAAKLSASSVKALTGDRSIAQTQEKKELARRYPVSIIEMEGYGYIARLQQRNIAVAMLRVVSDDLSGNIPNLHRAIDPYGNLRAIPLAIAFCRQPVAALRLIRGSLTGLKVLEQITTQLNS